ncbi:MAG: pectate lyase [Planctomycetaceae bacterium]|nr:pectate lyase [Planctomycetaceae bacterium]
MITTGVWLLLAACTVAAGPVPVPAFHGAEGFGANTPGGRGGKVPRIIVFRVSGVIDLRAPLEITTPFITIAGQTAPGGGVCLQRFGCKIETHDVIIRHLRFRRGDAAKKQLDALSVYKSQNVIIDHCSASWSTDECLSVTGEGCTDVTVQWCLSTESLNESVHAKGSHGYGSLIRTDGDITFHHNLYAHHKTRCPRPGTYGKERGILLDFRNKVIYDWGNPTGYTSQDKATINYVGNYLKPGPSTTNKNAVFKIGVHATKMFVAGNHLVGGGRENSDNWLMIQRSEPRHRADEPLAGAPVQTETATDAYRVVLGNAGATVPTRDPVDRRIVEQVGKGTGRIIDSQNEVGGWPEYDSTVSPRASDNDGMPDDSERSHRLDPTKRNANGRDLDPNYDNVEVYINSLLPTPG